MKFIKLEFFKSPYFVPEFNNWHLKKGAPQKVVDEFKKFMNDYKELSKIKQ